MSNLWCTVFSDACFGGIVAFWFLYSGLANVLAALECAFCFYGGHQVKDDWLEA